MMEVAAPDRPNWFWNQTKIEEADFFRPTAGAPVMRAGLALGCGGSFSPARRGAAPMMRPVTRELCASPVTVFRPATREVKVRTVGMRDVNAWRAERSAGRPAGPTALPAPPAVAVKQWAPVPPVGPIAPPVTTSTHEFARPANANARSSSAEAAPAAPLAAAAPIGVVARAPSAPSAVAAPAPSPVTIRTGFRGIGAGGGVRTGGLSRRAVPTVSALRAVETEAISAGTPR